MKAVLYAAKSTEDKNLSIPTQLTDCRGLCKRDGLAVEAEYHDEAKSAYNGSRGDGLARAKEHAERVAAEDGECALVVQHTDRLARGDGMRGDHLIQVVFWARKAGVTIRSDQDDSTCENRIMATVMGERNFEDSRRKGEAVKSGIRRRVVERHQYPGGRRPFGYRWDVWLDEGRKRHSRLVPDIGEAAVVRRIFAEYVGGRAQNAIARDLQREGVPTIAGGDWYATTVAGMIQNPLYVGQITLGGEHYDADHEPLIDRETWDRACELREARGAQGRPRGRRTTGRHVLTEGLLPCPMCASAMSPVKRNDRRSAGGQGYETYVCVKRLHHGPDACAQKPIKRALIDGAVFAYFLNDMLDLDATRELLVAQVEQALASEGDLYEQAERELALAEASLERIESDYVAGRISAEKMARLEERVGGEAVAARAQAEQHRGQRDAVEAMVAEFDAQAAVVEQLSTLRERVVGEVREGSEGDLEQFRAILRRSFDSFELEAQDGGGWLLRPWMRLEQVELWTDDSGQRVGVRAPLHANLCSLLAA